MTKALVLAKVRLIKALEERNDSGQGALEYVGAILVAAAVIGIVYAAVKGAGLDAKVSDAVKSIFDQAK